MTKMVESTKNFTETGEPTPTKITNKIRHGIFVPEDDEHDGIRSPEYYNNTYKYLRKIGIRELNSQV